MESYCRSELVAVTEVAESRYDVFVLVHSRVDGGAPDRGLVVGEYRFDMVNALFCGDDAADMDALGRAFRQESLVAQLHAATGGEHWVGDDERLGVDAWRGEILDVDAYLAVFLVGIFAVGRDKGVARMVEDVEKALMKRQSGTEDRGQHNLVRRHVDACDA